MKTVIIDPGHGGIDPNGNYTTPGKQYKHSSGEIAYEGVLNRNIAQALGDKMRRLLYNVIYTVRPDDYKDISLTKRVLIANKNSKEDTVFVSIHNNAGGGRGFEIFTTPTQNNSDKLSEFIFRQVEKIYRYKGLSMRYDISDGDHDKEANFQVIKGANMPAVLIECLFFDNYKEFKLLKDSCFINELTDAIALGIDDFFKNK